MKPLVNLVLLLLIALGGMSFWALMPAGFPVARFGYATSLVAGIVAFTALALLPLRDNTKFISGPFYAGIVSATAAAGLIGITFLYLNMVLFH